MERLTRNRARKVRGREERDGDIEKCVEAAVCHAENRHLAELEHQLRHGALIARPHGWLYWGLSPSSLPQQRWSLSPALHGTLATTTMAQAGMRCEGMK